MFDDSLFHDLSPILLSLDLSTAVVCQVSQKDSAEVSKDSIHSDTHTTRGNMPFDLTLFYHCFMSIHPRLIFVHSIRWVGMELQFTVCVASGLSHCKHTVTLVYHTFTKGHMYTVYARLHAICETAVLQPKVSNREYCRKERCVNRV